MNGCKQAAPTDTALMRRKIRLRHAGQFVMDQMDLSECPVCGRLANEAGCLDKHCSNRRCPGNETVDSNQFTLTQKAGGEVSTSPVIETVEEM